MPTHTNPMYIAIDNYNMYTYTYTYTYTDMFI